MARWCRSWCVTASETRPSENDRPQKLPALHDEFAVAARGPQQKALRRTTQRALLPATQTADCSSMMIRQLVIALSLMVCAVPTWASTSRRSSRSAPRSAPRSAGRTERRSTATRTQTSSTKCTSCARTANGRIARSPAARRSFQASHPCQATGKTSGACKGYVIDHVVPLKRGGDDAPSNMQWQTTAAARAKDKIE